MFLLLSRNKTLLWLILLGCILKPYLSISQEKDNNIFTSTFIEKGAEWYYHDEDYLQEKDWLTQQFLSPDQWKKGRAPFGYDMDDIATVISFGQDSTKKTLTSYYHKTLFIENPSKFYAYKLNVRRDDGAVIYLNGKEAWRTNMPNINQIKNKTKSLEIVKNEEENAFFSKVLFPSNFINGINIIAVEVHQRGRSTSDCVFDLELIGTNDLEYLNEFLKNQDSQNAELKDEIKDLEYKIEFAKHETELSSLKTRKSIINIVMIILFLFLAILSIFYIRLIQKRTKEKSSSEKSIKDLKESTQIKEKELLSLSLRNIQNNQQLELIHDDLNKIIKNFKKTNSTDSEFDLKKLEKIISQNLNQEDEWLELQKHFNIVHSGFFNRLTKQYPSLSQVELRHCSLIRLHLSTKEIARYLYINPKSVQASRYRIKKKMQLDESIDLKSYLINY